MNVLWLSNFSMRSYKTGRYSVLKDGNFQLNLSRIMASGYQQIVIGLPDFIDEELSDVISFLKSVLPTSITWKVVQFTFGTNIAETRKVFWSENADKISNVISLDNIKLMITDITGVHPCFKDIDVIYNFNVTKIPQLPRPILDEVFDTDIASIQRSLFTTVLNKAQKDYIVSVRPDLEAKVIVHTKCYHLGLKNTSVGQVFGTRTIFWPFRLSDSGYQFEAFYNAMHDQGLLANGWRIVASDPNGSAVPRPGLDVLPNVTKRDYYAMLTGQPKIVMLDNIDLVLHPGTIEMMAYGAQVITIASDLLNTSLSVNSVDHAVSTLMSTLPEFEVDLKDFVYEVGERDPHYS